MKKRLESIIKTNYLLIKFYFVNRFKRNSISSNCLFTYGNLCSYFIHCRIHISISFILWNFDSSYYKNLIFCFLYLITFDLFKNLILWLCLKAVIQCVITFVYFKFEELFFRETSSKKILKKIYKTSIEAPFDLDVYSFGIGQSNKTFKCQCIHSKIKMTSILISCYLFLLRIFE